MQYTCMFFFQKIKTLLHNNSVSKKDKLRLVMLYALRYETHSNNDLSALVDTLRRQGAIDKQSGVCTCTLFRK